MPLVDVIITTCHRDGRLLSRSVSSVLRQSVRDLSIVVVDDNGRGSNDQLEVQRLIESIDDHRLIYVVNETNMGACAARNVGIRRGRAPFVAFLDDDDEWMEDKIKLQLAAMRQEEIVLASCDFVKVFDGGRRRDRVVRRSRTPDYYQLLWEGNTIGSTSFAMVRRDVLEEVGLFDIRLQSLQDADLWLRLLRVGRAVILPEVLVRYHVHDGGQISSNPQRKYAGLTMVYDKYRSDIRLNRKGEARWLREIGRYAVCVGNLSEGRTLLWRALRLSPGSVYANVSTVAKTLLLRS